MPLAEWKKSKSYAWFVMHDPKKQVHALEHKDIAPDLAADRRETAWIHVILCKQACTIHHHSLCSFNGQWQGADLWCRRCCFGNCKSMSSSSKYA